MIFYVTQGMVSMSVESLIAVLITADADLEKRGVSVHDFNCLGIRPTKAIEIGDYHV